MVITQADLRLFINDAIDNLRNNKTTIYLHQKSQNITGNEPLKSPFI
jgi:hypothetical protein